MPSRVPLFPVAVPVAPARESARAREGKPQPETAAGGATTPQQPYHGKRARVGLRHSLSYLVRQADAATGFRAGVMVEEFVYNLLGLYMLPVVLARHGVAGAANRSYLGVRQVFFWVQAVNVTAFIVINVLYGVYSGTPGFPLSLYELLVLDALNALRVLTIAVKYSTFTLAEAREMDHAVLPARLRNDKLVLGGWAAPSDHLLFTEMERAVVRTCAHLGKQNAIFPDATSRNAVLAQVEPSVTSFLQFELCAGHLGDTTTEEHVAACGFCASVGRMDPLHALLHLQPGACTSREMSVAVGEPTGGGGDVGSVVVVAASSSAAGGGLATARQGGGGTARVPASTTPPLPDATTIVHGVPAPPSTPPVPLALHTHVYRAPDPGTFVKAHVPIPVLPALPVKLLLWHTLRTAYASVAPAVAPAFRIAFVVAIAFALMPLAVRAAIGRTNWRDVSGPGAAAMAILTEQTFFYFYTTLGFVVVASLDQTRRLATAQQLDRLLDHTSLIGLRMHDAQAWDMDDDGGEAGERGRQHAVALPTSPVLAWGASSPPASSPPPDNPTAPLRSRAATGEGRSTPAGASSGTLTAASPLRTRSSVELLRAVHNTYLQPRMNLYPTEEDEAFSPVLHLSPARTPSTTVDCGGGGGGGSGNRAVIVLPPPLSSPTPTPSTSAADGSPPPPEAPHASVKFGGDADSVAPPPPPPGGEYLRAGTATDHEAVAWTESGGAATIGASPSLRARHAVSRRMRDVIVSRMQLLSPDEVAVTILDPSTAHPSLPLM